MSSSPSCPLFLYSFFFLHHTEAKAEGELFPSLYCIFFFFFLGGGGVAHP